MRILKITTAYPAYVRDFYRTRPGLETKSYTEQKKVFDEDAFGLADFWSHALIARGCEALDLTANIEPIQRSWALEHGMNNARTATLDDIVLEQMRQFKPDVLWFDNHNARLLEKIRSTVPSLRLVLGWVGSAIPRTDVWQYMDVVLSCAQESVERLEQDGIRARQLHHAFEPRVLDRLKHRERTIDISFIGQIVRGKQFHLEREQILEQLARHIHLQIFSPSAGLGMFDALRFVVANNAYSVVKALRMIGVSERILRTLPFVNRIALLPARPMIPINKKLQPLLQPGVFGLKMYQTIRDSRVNLNIHADSSPHYASNMRLFEATGVGTCLVTDWKKNIAELFEPDKEIVTYRSAGECAEKVQWLLDHPKEREEIAARGQARTLGDHTFTRRAEQLIDIINRYLRTS